MKLFQAVPAALMLLTLTACGGSGSGGVPATPVALTTTGGSFECWFLQSQNPLPDYLLQLNADGTTGSTGGGAWWISGSEVQLSNGSRYIPDNTGSSLQGVETWTGNCFPAGAVTPDPVAAQPVALQANADHQYITHNSALNSDLTEYQCSSYKILFNRQSDRAILDGDYSTYITGVAGVIVNTSTGLQFQFASPDTGGTLQLTGTAEQCNHISWSGVPLLQ